MSGVIAAHAVISGGGADAAYDAAVLANAPLGYWKCNETSGTTAADSSGNSRPLTINGSVSLNATAVHPHGSGAFAFPGATASNISAVYAAWMATASFSWEAWVELNSISSYRSLLTRDASTPRGPAWYISGGKHDLFQTADTFGTATLSTSTNYHLGVAHNNAAGSVSFYINGALDRTATGVSFANTSVQDLIFGASHAGASSLAFPLDGRASHIAYYGAALTATDFANHYAAR